MPPPFKMKINIETIPHSEQRYETPGDYWYDELGVLQIRVSDLGNKKFEALIAIHEFIEQQLTEWKGITEEEISQFDIDFENKRIGGNLDEPGFDSAAPYKTEHYFATSVELGMCALAGLDWKEYENIVNKL